MENNPSQNWNLFSWSSVVLCIFGHGMITHTKLFAGKSYWRGRLSTVDLLLLTSLGQLLFTLKIFFTSFTKQVTLTRSSTVLNLPFELVFPAIWQELPKTKLANNFFCGKKNYQIKNMIDVRFGDISSQLCQQGDQIGQNFTIWAIFYGIGQNFF